MNNYIILTCSIVVLMLTGCSQMPAECEDSWTKMEKFAIDSGMPSEAVKTQKEQFVSQIKTMSKQDAIKACKMQNSFLTKTE